MKAPATRFEDLVVWQKAPQFVLATYRVTRTFPKSETYGLSSSQAILVLTSDSCLPE